MMWIVWEDEWLSRTEGTEGRSFSSKSVSGKELIAVEAGPKEGHQPGPVASVSVALDRRR